MQTVQLLIQEARASGHTDLTAYTPAQFMAVYHTVEDRVAVYPRCWEFQGLVIVERKLEKKLGEERR